MPAEARRSGRLFRDATARRAAWPLHRAKVPAVRPLHRATARPAGGLPSRDRSPGARDLHATLVDAGCARGAGAARRVRRLRGAGESAEVHGVSQRRGHLPPRPGLRRRDAPGPLPAEACEHAPRRRSRRHGRPKTPAFGLAPGGPCDGGSMTDQGDAAATCSTRQHRRRLPRLGPTLAGIAAMPYGGSRGALRAGRLESREIPVPRCRTSRPREPRSDANRWMNGAPGPPWRAAVDKVLLVDGGTQPKLEPGKAPGQCSHRQQRFKKQGLRPSADARRELADGEDRRGCWMIQGRG